MARVRSVLLVDFDNIYGATSEDVVNSLSNWLLWLEDGALSHGQKRRTFVHKRVYWNLQFDKYRPDFERAGFEAFNVSLSRNGDRRTLGRRARHQYKL